MHSALPSHDVVLLGVGHTNAHVLRMWKMHRPPGARLTCVSNFPTVTYSGMLPGVLAQQYSPERMQIDLVRLCAASGARLLVDDVTGLDPQNRTLQFADRPELPFDVLSIGIGSVPTATGVALETGRVLPIKPMQTFRERLGERLRQLTAARPARPLRVAIVGGGVAGVEIALCLPHAIRSVIQHDHKTADGDAAAQRSNASQPLTILLINAHSTLAPGMNARSTRRLKQELQNRGVELYLDHRVETVTESERAAEMRGCELRTSRETLQADLVVWATGAAPPPLLEELPLSKDAQGFLLTDSTLAVQNAAGIFAVGDTGTIAGADLPKAGVYAVREGPVLWENIQRRLRGEELTTYEPQKDFLRLVNLGDGRALGQLRGITFSGRWAWKLKDFIDSRFMDKYQDYSVPDMSMSAESDEGKSSRIEPDAERPDARRMRCVGCGGKVGGQALRRALARLNLTHSDASALQPATPSAVRRSVSGSSVETRPPVWGVAAGDDVAVLEGDARPWLATTDFFAAPLDDPVTVGRIAALNAVSDIFASGGRPTAALAIASVPFGSEFQQEQILFEVLAGAMREFDPLGIALVGGHTIEGPRLTIGFTILGHPEHAEPIRKSSLQAGDCLVLTKPLGTGVLLAAHMQAACRADWFQSLLKTILAGNADSAVRALNHDVHALTDVTGFGLAGHLSEMLLSRRGMAELWLDQVPLLPGVAELLQSGYASTLEPANRAVDVSLEFCGVADTQPAARALFDPQTNGGLLMSLSPAQAAAFCERPAVDEKNGQGNSDHVPGRAASGGWIIGRITAVESTSPELRVLAGRPEAGRVRAR